MAKDMEALYAERLKRYVTAMRNEKPDRIPIRPFVAEFTARYAGYTCQEVTHDYEKAFAAARKCAADFDWDAVVANMVYVWTGLTQSIGLKYYGIPGIGIPADVGFQYREPSEDHAFMEPDEYDALIEDPTGFLFNVWLPRASADVSPMGELDVPTATTSRFSRAAWPCCLTSARLARRSTVATGERNRVGHCRDPEGAYGHLGRQIARLRGADHGSFREARTRSRQRARP